MNRLEGVTLNQRANYLGQRSSGSQVIIRTHRQADTHTSDLLPYLDHLSGRQQYSVQYESIRSRSGRENETTTDANSYRNCLVGRARRKSRKAVDQEATLFRRSKVQRP